MMWLNEKHIWKIVEPRRASRWLKMADTNITCCVSASMKFLYRFGNCEINCSGSWSNTHCVQQELPETQVVWTFFYHLSPCFLSIYSNLIIEFAWLVLGPDYKTALRNLFRHLKHKWTCEQWKNRWLSSNTTFERLLTLVKYAINLFILGLFLNIVFLNVFLK